MLVDSGAIVNVMSYPLYKKLGGIKTNMTIIGVGGGTPILARGIANMAHCWKKDPGYCILRGRCAR
jgi:hypothetical protein